MQPRRHVLRHNRQVLLSRVADSHAPVKKKDAAKFAVDVHGRVVFVGEVPLGSALNVADLLAALVLDRLAEQAVQDGAGRGGEDDAAVGVRQLREIVRKSSFEGRSYL